MCHASKHLVGQKYLHLLCFEVFKLELILARWIVYPQIFSQASLLYAYDVVFKIELFFL